MADSRTKLLLLTLGGTPQVVTETVWALIQLKPAWVPDRILLLTTAEISHRPDGKTLARLAEQLSRLSNAFGLADLGQRIEIITAHDKCGEPLADLRTAASVESFAETLTTLVTRLTSDESVTLHMSMAGGRKTMSFIAGQLMSLLARTDDRLSHVLVHPAELESNMDFWWPDSRYIDARVELHQVPFIRLRAWLGAERLDAMASLGFSGAVNLANEAVGEAHARLDLGAGRLRVAETEIHLAPREAAILALAAIAGKRRQKVAVVKRWHPHHPKWTTLALDGELSAASRLWAWLVAASDLPRILNISQTFSLHDFDQAMDGFARRMATGDGGAEPSHPYGELVGQPLSRLRRKLGKALPPLLAQRLMARGAIACDLAQSVIIHAPSELTGHPDCPAEIES